MDKTKIQDLNSQLFSNHLLSQQELNSLKHANEEIKHLSHSNYSEYSQKMNINLDVDASYTTRGHGPFIEMSDGSIKYDLTCSNEGLLIGHSHPLLIKSHLESSGLSRNTSNSSYVSELENSITKNLLQNLKVDEFENLRFFNNDLASLKETLKNIISLDISKNLILVIGEIPSSLFDLSLRSLYAPNKRGPLDLEIIQISEKDYNDQKEIKNLYKEYKKYLAAILINFENSHNPASKIDINCTDAICTFFKENNCPTILCELNNFGSKSELFSINHFNSRKLFDYYLIGKNSQLNLVFSRDKFNSSTKNTSLNFSDLILTEKILIFLKTGNFYGANGKIAKIEKEFSKKLNLIIDELGSSSLSYNSNGLIFEIKVSNIDDSKSKKFFDEFLSSGIICNHKDNNLNIYFPITIMNEHLSEIAHILEKNIQHIQGE